MRKLKIFLAICGLLLAGCGQKPNSGSSSEQPRATRSAEARSTRTGARYDLSKDEDRGGHTLRKHVGRSDEQLRQRLERERDISAASTWTDRTAAEETVGAALEAESGRIEIWMRRGEPRPNLALHFDTGREVGRSLIRGSQLAMPCTRAVIVLRADRDGYYVLTAYPEARE